MYEPSPIWVSIRYKQDFPVIYKPMEKTGAFSVSIRATIVTSTYDIQLAGFYHCAKYRRATSLEFDCLKERDFVEGNYPPVR